MAVQWEFREDISPQFAPGSIFHFVQIQGESIRGGGSFLARFNLTRSSLYHIMSLLLLVIDCIHTKCEEKDIFSQ